MIRDNILVGSKYAKKRTSVVLPIIKKYTLLQIVFQHVTNEKERKFLSHGLFYFGPILFCRDTTEAGKFDLN